MPGEEATGVLVKIGPLRSLVTTALAGAGAPEDEAATLADSLLDASLRGVDSHGINLLPEYLARIRAGGWTVPAVIRVVSEEGAMTLLDGGGSLGQVVATRAMRLAMELSTKFGIGAVSVRNSSHFGAAGYYARIALEQDLIGVVLTNASPAMAPHGGTEKLLGSNPWAIAVPSNEECETVLDISNSVVARSWIRLAAQLGRQIPSGWAADEEGAPTTDPLAALRGALLPIAGHKGYGIAFMVDCLAGILSGSAFGPDVLPPFVISDTDSRPPLTNRQNVGHLMIAANPAAVRPISAFKSDVSSLVHRLRQSRPITGVESVMTPGEPECRAFRSRSQDGVPVRAEVLAQLQTAGAAVMDHGQI